MMAKLRTAREAEAAGHGWKMISDRNLTRSKVLLFSLHSPVLVEFPHGEPYHAHLRAIHAAKCFADDHPQKKSSVCAAPARELVIEPLVQQSCTDVDVEEDVEIDRPSP